MEDFCDSKVAKSHPLFSQDSKALQILLYYDEIELCNPIGNSKTKHCMNFHVNLLRTDYQNRCLNYTKSSHVLLKTSNVQSISE